MIWQSPGQAVEKANQMGRQPRMKQIPVLLCVIIYSLVAGCAGLPTTTRTGKSAEVAITDHAVSPRDVVVQPGDEVRIVNRRSGPIWVYFNLEDHLNDLSCKRGFSFFLGVEESAKIKPNQSASLCFTKAGVYGYSVQAQPTNEGGGTLGEITIPAAIPAAVVVEDRR
jgi:plastocyanin